MTKPMSQAAAPAARSASRSRRPAYSPRPLSVYDHGPVVIEYHGEDFFDLNLMVGIEDIGAIARAMLDSSRAIERIWQGVDSEDPRAARHLRDARALRSLAGSILRARQNMVDAGLASEEVAR